MSEVTQAEIDALFERIVAGKVDVVARAYEPEYGLFCGDYVYETSDGWSFSAFIDCGEFDYLNWVRSPEGRETGLAASLGEPPYAFYEPNCELPPGWDTEFLGVQAPHDEALNTRVKWTLHVTSNTR